MFTDNIQENCDILTELIRNVPPSQRARCRYAAVQIEKVFMALQADHPKDPAIALGAAYAIYMIGARIVQQAKEGKHDSLIQLIG